MAKSITIKNFLPEYKLEWLRNYAEMAISNPSMQVSFVQNGEQTRVDRLYYSLNTPLWIFQEIRLTAQEQFPEFAPLTFRPDSYGHIMHYKEPGDGLQWHKDKDLGRVSASLNLTPDENHDGGDLEVENMDIDSSYNTLNLYSYDTRHRVSDLNYGEKMSLVLWLPQVGQKVSGQDILWKFE